VMAQKLSRDAEARLHAALQNHSQGELIAKKGSQTNPFLRRLLHRWSLP
jgi:hypothetical protein